jgi:hypothetical protein
MLVKPAISVAVAPNSISVAPIVTLSLTNLSFAIVPTAILPFVTAKSLISSAIEALVALSANDLL